MIRKRTNRNLLPTILVTLVLLAGCMSDAGDPPAAADGDGSRDVPHALGTTTIEGTPERVVVLEWPFVEALLAVGVQPVGVADVEGYTNLVASEPGLADDVVDVGTRQEPSLEDVAALDPDLIIGVKFRHESLFEDLSAISPTIVLDTFPEDGEQLANMEANVRTIGAAVGREAAAAAALADLHATLADAKARLTAAGVDGDAFILSQILAGDSGELRLFQGHHLAVDLIAQAGLSPAWVGDWNDKGFSTVGMEALADVDHAHFFYVLSQGASLDAFESSPVWNEYAFVKEERLHDFTGAWLLPGPLSGQGFIASVVAALAPDAEPLDGDGDARPVTVTHALGTTTIEGTPERVVALEWTYVEDLLAVGVQPVGVADVAGYEAWVNVPVALSEDVVDVGTRQEPSLEKIAELEPDLIIGAQFRHEAIFDDLSAIAPTIAFNPYPGEQEDLGQYQEMEETFRAIAKAVGREARASQVLTDLDAHYEDAEATLSELGAHGNEVLLVQAFTWEDSPTMRVFTHNAMASWILQRIGLENAWTEDFETYGFSTVGLEALEPVQHADFHYVAQEDDDPFRNQWKDNPVWNSYEFVQEERVYPLGGDTWLFGGPLSAKLVVDRVIADYTG